MSIPHGSAANRLPHHELTPSAGPQAAGVQHGFMCDGGGSPTEVAATLPRPAEGTAVDPIALEPVDEVVITSLVPNAGSSRIG